MNEKKVRQVDAVIKKFALLQEIVASKPSLVEHFKRMESLFRAAVEKYGPQSRLLEGAHREIRVQTRDLLDDTERQIVKPRLDAIDAGDYDAH